MPFRLSIERCGLKIIPRKRNLSVLISLAVGHVVAIALLAVFFALVSALEKESSWYHRMSYYHAFFITSSSFAITGLVGAAIPYRRGEDAVRASDTEAAETSVQLRALPPQATAATTPKAFIAPAQKNITTLEVLDLGYGAGSSSDFGTGNNLCTGSLSGSTRDPDSLSLDGVSVVSLNTRLERDMAELVDRD